MRSIYFLFLLLILRSCISASPPITLDPDGGYHLRISVNAPSPSNFGIFRGQIQELFQGFSNFLYETTQTFSIKSINLIVPPDWNTGNDADGTAPLDEYNGAQITITDQTGALFAENPGVCGRKGTGIKIPWNIFEGKEGPFDPGDFKGLLHLWAKYRYGIWEEHGFPGDSQFPYYVRGSSEDEWILNGCSDVFISGEILHINEGDCTINDDIYPPESECRFFPDDPQPDNPTTSLMHIHWLPSVTRFCDSSNHNRESPNRHNLYCGYKSIWEIIETSRDFDEVVEPVKSAEVTVITLKLERQVFPLLHILLDRGPTLAPPEVFNKIRQSLIQLINNNPFANIASLSTFPRNDADAPDSPFYNYGAIDWSLLSSQAIKDRFMAFIGQYTLGGPEFRNRNFGRAIKESVDKIRSKQHAPGGILVIVKTGGGRGSYDKLDFEQEVVGSLREGNIRVYVLEIFESERNPSLHLKLLTLTNVSNGFHSEIKTIGEGLDDLLSGFNGHVTQALAQGSTPRNHFRMAYKGVILPGQPLDISILTKEFKDLSFYLTLTTNQVEGLTLNQVGRESSSSGILQFDQEQEWNENIDGSRRFNFVSYQDDIDNTVREGMIWRMSYQCENCEGFLVVYGEIDGNSAYSDSLEYTVFTSSESNVVDFEEINSRNESVSPFVIYLKMEDNGIPIYLNEKSEVFATIRRLSSQGEVTDWDQVIVPLVDDGKGSPDVVGRDGIFSGSFYPKKDGIYRIFVSIFFREDSLVLPQMSSRLFPRPGENQTFMGCGSGNGGCDTWQPLERFQRIIDLYEPIYFLNTGLYEPKPDRILDLDAVPENDFRIRLTWSRPGIFGAESDDLLEWSVFGASYFDGILYEDWEEVTCDLEKIVGQSPGVEETCRFTGTEGVVYYIAVEASFMESRSISNIVRVTPTLEYTPTTTTTTTPKPRPTTPTTERTTRPTTVRTTTTPATTFNPDGGDEEDEERDKYWIEKPEGYIPLIVFFVVLIGFGVGYFLFIRYCRGSRRGSPKKTVEGKPMKKEDKWNKAGGTAA